MESSQELRKFNNRLGTTRVSNQSSSVVKDSASTVGAFENDEDQTLIGPRSLSLTALSSADPHRPNSVIEPLRMAQLETLEAKMANIEVSLSALAGTRRTKKNGFSSGTTRSLYAASICGNSASNSRETSRELAKEMEFLKQGMKDKDNLILNLQGQLRKLAKRKSAHGSITSTDSGVVSLRILSENERKAAEDRLAQLDKDMEIKRVEIKRINHRLERLNPSDNIDVRIQQAELEYELEREELNLMNLQEERRNLHTILDDNDAFQKRTENSLFASIPVNSHLSLHSFEVVYEAGEAASFTVGKREDRTGTFVMWTREDLKTLKRGDRIIELNGTLVVSKGVNRVEEFWTDEENNEEVSDLGSHPLRIVVLRTPPPPPPPRAPNREIHTLKEELNIVTARLEEVASEKRELQAAWHKIQKDSQIREEVGDVRRVEVDQIIKDRDMLRTEAVRLKHRISYLEEQVTDLLHRKEVNGAVTSVFQKGNHKAIVSEPIKGSKRGTSPPRPPSVASTRTSESRQALKTRIWETFRRATSSDSRSVCSVDSGSGFYFRKREKKKPQPPTKPVRLSLQRATSTTNVYPSELPEMNPGLRRSNYSEHTLPEWSADDLRSEPEKTKRSGRQSGIRWPSLRPASSMSYTMGSRPSTTVAKF